VVDFRSGYVPPGVYVSTDSTGSVAAVGVESTVICLVGRGLGYQTYTEQVSFSGGNAQPLTQKGIDSASVVVSGTIPVSGVPTPITFTPDGVSNPHDYSVSQTGSGTAKVTTLNRTPSGQIPTSGTVQVTYHYTDDDYFALNGFSDYASFEAVYGAPFDPATGDLLSPLSLAAQIAFQNGASIIYAVSLSGTGSAASQYSAAYELTLPNFDINLLVPLFETATDGSTAQSLATALVAHLNNAETEGFPRTAIFGLPSAFTGETPDILAQQIDYRRVVMTWPNQFLFYNSLVNQTQTLDGIYFAAACAGVLANQSMNRGLTRSQIRSFTGIPAAVLRNMSTSNKNTWSSKGVAVAEIDRNGRLVVRHGVTTDVSTVQNRELSIVRCQDALFNLIQTSLTQADLIGDPITATTALSVKGIIAGALETALSGDIIQGYTNLLVRQQTLPSGDPTVIECTFSYSPTYPLNYITVVFTLDLTTGDLSVSDSASGSSNSNPITTG
jgi:hypothetical protein